MALSILLRYKRGRAARFRALLIRLLAAMARAGLGSPYATFVQASAEAATMADASANPTTAAAEAAANQETAEATAVPTSDPGTPNPTTPQQFRLHTPLDSGATTIQ